MTAAPPTAVFKISRYLLHVMLPRRCAHCREDLHYLDEGPLCPSCAASLEPAAGLCCRRCGLPLEAGGETCFACRSPEAARSPVRLARSAFVFNPAIRSVIHAFKYGGRRRLAARLGLELAAAYDRFPELKAYDQVMAVPLFKDRERERGFNQSALLAEALARERGLRLLEGAAVRRRRTTPQAGLPKAERRENVRGAFEVTSPEAVKGGRILIIDDVATTLSTAEELARALKEAGAADTAVFTLAREPVREREEGG